MLKHLYPFGISLIIGLFIGIERERSHPAGSQPMGVRTFMLIALMGTLSATINNPMLTLSASLFAFAIILLSYHKSSRRKGKHRFFGITTEIAAAVVFFLGYLTPEMPLLSAVIGIAVLLALLSRTRLHVFSRSTVKTKEIYAAITILLIGLCILPFLPNHTIDPWKVFNPRRYTMLVLILSIIEFGGYIAIRLFGEKLGVLLTAFLSGLVSSTAAFLMLTKLSKSQQHSTRMLVASGLLATNAMLIETTILLSLISQRLIEQLLIPILAMLAIGFLSTWPVLKDQEKRTQSLTPTNPLDLKGVIKIATFIIGMLVLITITKRTIGTSGVHFISFLGGLFEVHSVNIANASLFANVEQSLQQTVQSIGLALAASFVTKYFLLWTVSRKKFAIRCSIYLSIMLAVGSASFFMFSI